MTQKKVDAIVLEIFNICREKELNFEFRSNRVTEAIVIRYYNNDDKLIFKVESYIKSNCKLFGYANEENTYTIQDALEQVKQYKK